MDNINKQVNNNQVNQVNNNQVNQVNNNQVNNNQVNRVNNNQDDNDKVNDKVNNDQGNNDQVNQGNNDQINNDRDNNDQDNNDQDNNKQNNSNQDQDNNNQVNNDQDHNRQNNDMLINNQDKNFINKNILVFSGGGIKGIALIGCLRILEKLEIINNIKIFAGASVGSLIIALYNLGYCANELYKFIKDFNFETTQNIDVMNIFSCFGIDNGKKIELMIEKLIINKKYDKNITLLELYEKTKKELIFSSVCLNTTQVEYISYKNYPDLSLIKAIRMSISIPWYYTPVEINGKLYVDGGCIDNYPIHLFKNEIQNVIGIYLLDSYTDIETINNFETFSSQVIKCFMKGMSFNSTKSYENYTIFVDLRDINIINYNLSIDKKKELCKIGLQSVLNWIKN